MRATQVLNRVAATSTNVQGCDATNAHQGGRARTVIALCHLP